MSTNIFSDISKLITSWRFAAFVITLCVATTFILLAILLIPNAASGVGAFAQDFKVWCFGYDPATGGFEWAYVVVMLINPIILAGFVYLVWHQPLHRALRDKIRSVAATASVGLLAAGMLGGGLFALGPKQVEATDLPFPAERLRTELEPPAFELTDQTGQRVTLDQFEGEVVLLTAIYAKCKTACPAIMVHARRATADIPEEYADDVNILAITLDPENDDPEQLAKTAESHQVEAPLWRLLTGEPDEVNEVLDRLSVARQYNEETGEIEHANMFFLIDRDGKIAYRLNLGDRHSGWLKTGLKVLLEEG